jgi:hypothetical protein
MSAHIQESRDRFTEVFGRDRGAPAGTEVEAEVVATTLPAAAAVVALVPILDGNGQFESWPAQDQALSDFLDSWQKRHGETPYWDCSGDGNTGDPDGDFLEIDVYGEDSGEGFESITISADGTITF